MVPKCVFQTPQVAERMGYAAGMELASGDIKLLRDCSSVTIAVKLPVHRLYTARRKYVAAIALLMPAAGAEQPRP